MNDMLSRSFVVQSVPEAGFVALPSPNASEPFREVVFPESVVRDGEALKLGDIVRLNEREDLVTLSFWTSGGVFKDGRMCHVCFAWDRPMRDMLGKEFPVVQMMGAAIVALPWREKKIYFPVSVVSKVNTKHEAVVRKVF